MERISSIFRFFKSKTVIYWAIAALLVIVAGGWYFYKSREVKTETLTVHPGAFLQQVSISGKVIAAQNVDLGFSQSGRISAVYAKVGAVVPAGALVAETENGDLVAALEKEKAKLRSLEEGTRPEDIHVSEVAVQNAGNDVVNDIKNGYVNADDAIRNKVDQFISNPKGLSPQLSFAVNDSQLKTDIETGRTLMENTLVSWNNSISGLTNTSDMTRSINEAKTYLRAIQSYLDKIALAINPLIPSSTLSQTTIDAYKAAVVLARTNVTTALGSLTASEEKLRNAESALLLKQAGSTTADIDAQKAAVRAAEASLLKTRIFAPFSGVITRMDAKVGEIVSPNAPQISMISRGNFQVESYVPEINIALISLGNPAKVTLDAYGDNAIFDAKVISIDPAETIKDGVSTYKTILEFGSQDPRIKSGMTANVIITTKEKTGVIAVPQGIVISRDGKKYVKVKNGEAAEERGVLTGDISSLGQIEITKGLSDGDIVVLSPGTSSGN